MDHHRMPRGLDLVLNRSKLKFPNETTHPFDHEPLARYVKLRVRMRRECRERFPRHRRWAIPTCITARASRTCRDACRDRWLSVSFEIGGGGKRSRHSRRMRNQQFYVSGKRPMSCSRQSGYSRHLKLTPWTFLDMTRCPPTDTWRKMTLLLRQKRRRNNNIIIASCAGDTLPFTVNLS